MQQVNKIATLLATSLMTACATINECQTQEQLNSIYIERFGSVELGETYYKLHQDRKDYKDIDIDQVLKLANDPQGTPTSKTRYYRILASLYYRDGKDKEGDQAHEKSISYNGFINEFEKLAVEAEYQRSEDVLNFYKKYKTIDDLKSNNISSASYRTAAPVPRFARKSAYCYVQYDVTNQGDVENAKALFCTDQRYENYAAQSTLRWKYRPKKIDGTYVADRGKITQLWYDLYDRCGNRIPE